MTPLNFIIAAAAGAFLFADTGASIRRIVDPSTAVGPPDLFDRAIGAGVFIGAIYVGLQWRKS